MATVIGAVGGGAVTAIFDSDRLFGAYSIGLAVAFFAYLLVGLALEGGKGVAGWMEVRDQEASRRRDSRGWTGDKGEN